MTTTADARVASWPSITRKPGTIHRLRSGGVLVEVGSDFPVWREDELAARKLLRGLNLPAGAPVVDFPDSP